jgi:hypothetical protein
VKWALLAIALAGCDILLLKEHPFIPDAPAACAPEFASGRYAVFSRSTTWVEAEATCRSLTGISTYSHLAVVGDVAEAAVIGALVVGADPWVGLTTRGAPKDQFHWITREPAGIPWIGTQPDDAPRASGICGRVVDSGAGLADSACDDKRDMVCECDEFPVDEARL